MTASPEHDVHPLIDPTICADCRKDNGEIDYPTALSRHLCSACRWHWKRIQFPFAIRAACILCVVLGGWGFLRSLRVMEGIYHYRSGILAYREDRDADAARELEKALALVPDEEEYQDLKAYYSGLACLDEGKPAEAAKWFEKSFDHDPESKQTAHMLYLSQRRAAFEAKRYDAYLQASERLMDIDGRTHSTLLGLAPAWACKFAVTGREEFRAKSLECLEQARKTGPTGTDDWIIEGWVKQILQTRVIVSYLDYWYSIGKAGQPDQDFG